MKKTILIIDDEEGIRKVLSLTLSDAGHEVATAVRAKDGLELFQKLKPDLVITDLLMPGRGGCEALRLIKEQSPETPIVLLTGLAKAEAEIICQDYPDVVLVSKPIDMQELERAIAGAGLSVP